MLPNIGAPELIIILVIALLILGPGKLPEVGSSLGKSIREFRKASTDIQDSVKVDVDTRRSRPRPPPRRHPPHRLPRSPPLSPRRLPRRRGRAADSERRPPLRLRRRPTRRPSRASRSRSNRPWQTPTPCSSRVSPVVQHLPILNRARHRL